jgi:HAD superfamily hydrolase (TIGR01509 family)
MKYKAIIWDCDGVLIDSEKLACGASVGILAELGYSIPAEEYIERFMGKNDRQIFSEIAQETGLQLEENFPYDKLRTQVKQCFEESLKETPGISAVLQSFSALPMAVASGSSTARLAHSLTLTNLAGHFNGHVYSVELVKNGKPAPDVFLYAAQKLGIAPKDCLVVEDSIHGIAAAKAAGMDVFAYTGGSHMSAKLKQSVINAAPGRVFSDMRLLPSLAFPALLPPQPKQKPGNAP